MLARQRRGGEETQAALAQFLAVALDIQVAGHRAVGDHYIKALDGKVGQQAFEFVFAAVDAQDVVQLHGRGQQSIDDGFGNDVGDTDAKQDLFLRPCAQQGFQFTADLEHLFGIAQCLAASLGQLNCLPTRWNSSSP